MLAPCLRLPTHAIDYSYITFSCSADVTSSLLILDLPLPPVCKEEVSPDHVERSSSLVQEEPEVPPQIKEEQEEDLESPEEADGILISVVRSIAPSGKNFHYY